jgi:tryptophan synthase alpha chain
MSRLPQTFATLHRDQRTALIPFITAGDPSPEHTVALMHALVKAGADVIELGVPFSDPMADGPVIQRASERALAHGVSLHRVLQLVGQFRETDAATPVVLMGYLNPVECMGYSEFAAAAQDSGVDGVLTVDLPPEEAADLVAALRARQLDPVFLVAPTSSEARMQRIADLASGFIYYVSLKGVTGAANLDVAAVAEKLGQLRRHTRLPIGVGFGIRDPESAANVGRLADAVIVGSALVQKVEALLAHPDQIVDAMQRAVAEMRQALDRRGNAAAQAAPA